jgi:glycosyltransferase involved in cell wall biosynthesis
MFYSLQGRLSGVRIPGNVGDFRLLDRAVVDALKQLPERARFMRGLFAWVGFKSTTIDYVRKPRHVGKSKYSWWSLWNLALDGLTSFSIVPLQICSFLGAIAAFATTAYAIFILVRTLVYGVDVPGYASLLIAILFFGSVQLFATGLVGEYIGRIYMEAKQRPIYLIRKFHEADRGT